MKNDYPNLQGHIPALDGLRGFAILLVLGFHYFGFVPILSFGWSGVDLFFVLSGYLITGRLVASKGSPSYFSKFYRNRILRIFPVYFGVLILFYLGILLFTTKSAQPWSIYYLAHWKSFFLFTENWTFIYYGLPILPFLTHFWTLAVEEQFYFLWPSILFFLRNTRPRTTMITLLAMAAATGIARSVYFCYHPHPGNPSFFYFNTLFRMDSFIIGALLFHLHAAKVSIRPVAATVSLILSGSALLAAILISNSADAFQPFFLTIGYTHIAVFYACLLHTSVCYRGAFLTKIFSTPILRWTGKISYGLYIFHFLVLTILRQQASGLHIPDRALPFVGFLLTFLLAAFSFRYYETPFLRMKNRAPHLA